MVRPEEAGIGAAPASLAKAASDPIRPRCDQESTSWAAACGPTPGWSSSCGASLRLRAGGAQPPGTRALRGLLRSSRAAEWAGFSRCPPKEWLALRRSVLDDVSWGRAYSQLLPQRFS